MSKSIERRMAKTDGGPAFPRLVWDDTDRCHRPEDGMSLRDYIAIHAADVDVTRWKWLLPDSEHERAEPLSREAARYAYADAMLKERER